MEYQIQKERLFLKYLNLIITKENDNMNEMEITKLIDTYTNILNGNKSQEDDDYKKEDTKSSGNKSYIS